MTSDGELAARGQYGHVGGFVYKMEPVEMELVTMKPVTCADMETDVVAIFAFTRKCAIHFGCHH